MREYRKRYHKLNRDKIIKRVKEWNEKNKEHRRAYMLDYTKRSSSKRIEYRRKRRQRDIHFRVKGNLSHRITSVLRGYGAKKNWRRTVEIIGCELEFLRSYLEQRFAPGMTWGNYGNGDQKWVIDHRIPCNAFDLSDVEQQRKCFHYTNLQPMWWRENLIKQAKLPAPHQAEFL